MSGELFLLAALLALLCASILCVPLLSARLELRRVRRRYQLSDEEVAAYARELPEVCHAVADSLGPESSAREIRRIASDSTIVAILRERRRRVVEDRGGMPADLGRPRRDEPAGLTREDLLRDRPRR